MLSEVKKKKQQSTTVTNQQSKQMMVLSKSRQSKFKQLTSFEEAGHSMKIDYEQKYLKQTTALSKGLTEQQNGSHMQLQSLRSEEHFSCGSATVTSIQRQNSTINVKMIKSGLVSVNDSEYTIEGTEINQRVQGKEVKISHEDLANDRKTPNINDDDDDDNSSQKTFIVQSKSKGRLLKNNENNFPNKKPIDNKATPTQQLKQTSYRTSMDFASQSNIDDQFILSKSSHQPGNNLSIDNSHNNPYESQDQLQQELKNAVHGSVNSNMSRFQLNLSDEASNEQGSKGNQHNFQVRPQNAENRSNDASSSFHQSLSKPDDQQYNTPSNDSMSAKDSNGVNRKLLNMITQLGISDSGGDNNSSERREQNDTVRSLNWRPISLNDSQNIDLENVTANDIAIIQQFTNGSQEYQMESKLFRKENRSINRDHMHVDAGRQQIAKSSSLSDPIVIYQDLGSNFDKKELDAMFETNYSRKQHHRLSVEQKDQKQFNDTIQELPLSAESEYVVLNSTSHKDSNGEMVKNGTASFGIVQIHSVADQLQNNRDDKSDQYYNDDIGTLKHGNAAFLLKIKNANASQSRSLDGGQNLNNDSIHHHYNTGQQYFAGATDKSQNHRLSSSSSNRRAELTQQSNVVSLKLNVSGTLKTEMQSRECGEESRGDTYSIQSLQPRKTFSDTGSSSEQKLLNNRDSIQNEKKSSIQSPQLKKGDIQFIKQTETKTQQSYDPSSPEYQHQNQAQQQNQSLPQHKISDSIVTFRQKSHQKNQNQLPSSVRSNNDVGPDQDDSQMPYQRTPSHVLQEIAFQEEFITSKDKREQVKDDEIDDKKLIEVGTNKDRGGVKKGSRNQEMILLSSTDQQFTIVPLHQHSENVLVPKSQQSLSQRGNNVNSQNGQNNYLNLKKRANTGLGEKRSQIKSSRSGKEAGSSTERKVVGHQERVKTEHSESSAEGRRSNFISKQQLMIANGKSSARRGLPYGSKQAGNGKQQLYVSQEKSGDQQLDHTSNSGAGSKSAINFNLNTTNQTQSNYFNQTPNSIYPDMRQKLNSANNTTYGQAQRRRNNVVATTNSDAASRTLNQKPGRFCFDSASILIDKNTNGKKSLQTMSMIELEHQQNMNSQRRQIQNARVKKAGQTILGKRNSESVSKRANGGAAAFRNIGFKQGNRPHASATTAVFNKNRNNRNYTSMSYLRDGSFNDSQDSDDHHYHHLTTTSNLHLFRKLVNEEKISLSQVYKLITRLDSCRDSKDNLLKALDNQKQLHSYYQQKSKNNQKQQQIQAHERTRSTQLEEVVNYMQNNPVVLNNMIKSHISGEKSYSMAESISSQSNVFQNSSASRSLARNPLQSAQNIKRKKNARYNLLAYRNGSNQSQPKFVSKGNNITYSDLDLHSSLQQQPQQTPMSNFQQSYLKITAAKQKNRIKNLREIKSLHEQKVEQSRQELLQKRNSLKHMISSFKVTQDENIGQSQRILGTSDVGLRKEAFRKQPFDRFNVQIRPTTDCTQSTRLSPSRTLSQNNPKHDSSPQHSSSRQETHPDSRQESQPDSHQNSNHLNIQDKPLAAVDSSAHYYYDEKDYKRDFASIMPQNLRQQKQFRNSCSATSETNEKKQQRKGINQTMIDPRFKGDNFSSYGCATNQSQAVNMDLRRSRSDRRFIYQTSQESQNKNHYISLKRLKHAVQSNSETRQQMANRQLPNQYSQEEKQSDATVKTNNSSGAHFPANKFISAKNGRKSIQHTQQQQRM